MKRLLFENWNIVKVNMFAGCLIGLCVLVLSYTHTTALFERAGYRGIFAHVGVFGFEATFVLGTVTIIWSRWLGEKVGLPSRFVLILGVCVNLYSNITSGIAQNGKPLVFFVLNKNWVINEAVLIGAFIPLLIVAAEMVVNDALHKHRASNKQTGGLLVEEISIRRTTPKKEIKQQEIKQEIKQDKEIKHQTLEVEQDKEIKQEPVEEIKQSDNKKETIEPKKSNNRINHLLDESDNESPFDIAVRFMNETGTLPSIRKLAKQANVTTYRASKIIEELKQTAV